ncbi:hypothetical protein B0T16DRAFT_423274 [Cercophora newfieldiana]|uniref:Uncharacterized protein n=1 Tax=Cercophora newfieldiana TaxID=92897 RepID=A0AA39XSM5_9PEZI|nr:hypothetical protein B0T16DRAFT_423274 [Cercophora newfieldiana]
MSVFSHCSSADFPAHCRSPAFSSAKCHLAHGFRCAVSDDMHKIASGDMGIGSRPFDRRGLTRKPSATCLGAPRGKSYLNVRVSLRTN